MNLYLVMLENEDGESLDMFACGETPEEAVACFKKYWSDSHMLDASAFNGAISTDEDNQATNLTILKVNPSIGSTNKCKAGVIDWFGKSPGVIEYVGYIQHEAAKGN